MLYLETPPRLIETKVFSAMPEKFRRKGVASEWGDANRPGLPTDCFIEGPSFDAAAAPDTARTLYELFVERIRAAGLRCQTGRFQERMQVELVNEGPVTILLDSGKNF